MKKIILSTALIVLNSTGVFAQTGAFGISCSNTNESIKNQLSVGCNEDGSKCLIESRSLNSNRGIAIPLSIISARRNFLTLVNSQHEIKVVVNLETHKADIFDNQGSVATCE